MPVMKDLSYNKRVSASTKLSGIFFKLKLEIDMKLLS